MPRSALILGTLPGQADAILRLRSVGWRIFSCGHQEDGPGVAAADEFHLVDVLDVPAVTRLARNLDVDLVYSVGSDIAMPTVAKVSAELDLPTFHDVETTDILRHKDRLRDFFLASNISPVAFRVLRHPDELDDFDSFPAVVKPSDSQGQRGITVVDSAHALSSALPIAYANSRNGVVIVEEFLEGPEISIHVFVVGGEVALFLPSDRHVWDGPMTGVPEAHTMPSKWLDRANEAAARSLVDDVVNRLGISQGPLYFQLILTDSGPRIVEVAPRLDGCHLWRLIEFHTGFDLLTTCFSMLAGDPWPGSPTPPDPGATHTLRFHLASPKDRFDPVHHSLAMSLKVVFEEFHVAVGELPRDANGVVSRVGYAITRDDHP